jgi:hypothetical protein
MIFSVSIGLGQVYEQLQPSVKNIEPISFKFHCHFIFSKLIMVIAQLYTDRSHQLDLYRPRPSIFTASLPPLVVVLEVLLSDEEAASPGGRALGRSSCRTLWRTFPVGRPLLWPALGTCWSFSLLGRPTCSLHLRSGPARMRGCSGFGRSIYMATRCPGRGERRSIAVQEIDLHGGSVVCVEKLPLPRLRSS